MKGIRSTFNQYEQMYTWTCRGCDTVLGFSRPGERPPSSHEAEDCLVEIMRRTSAYNERIAAALERIVESGVLLQGRRYENL